VGSGQKRKAFGGRGGLLAISAAALFVWIIASTFGWLWWRYLKSGVVYSPGGKFTRAVDPFNYWFAMALLAAAAVGMTICAVWFTVLDLRSQQ